LPARHVIHAVGPVWNGGSQGEDTALASCYTSAFRLCQAHGLASIAFPAISTGVYRFPADRAAGIAVSTAAGALAAAPAVSRVIFCCFSDDSARRHAEAMAGFGSPCAD
jgi:O-acetyl-ADP-ribose deacetylase (regulator of RNase III)